jgi:tetratricopeptide (TPR) repeat protein
MNAGDLLMLQRRYPEAIRSLDQALEIEPGMRPAHLRRALALAFADRPTKATESLEGALAISGEDAMYLEYLALVESLGGNRAAAEDAASRLQAIADGGAQVSPWPLARAWAAAGQEATAIGHLRRAFEQRSTSMPFLAVSPVFEELRKHPDVRELIGKVGVPAL